VYRLADAADFEPGEPGREEANMYLVWLMVYREGPVTLDRLSELLQLPREECRTALERLVEDARVTVHPELPNETGASYKSSVLAVPMGSSKGWEAAVLDHYQAMLSAISAKLGGGRGSAAADMVGGSTWSLNVWPGHPIEAEARGPLARLRTELSDLRRRVDEHNAAVGHDAAAAKEQTEQVVVYVGQYLRGDEPAGEA
jgi:hypothetical protein